MIAVTSSPSVRDPLCMARGPLASLLRLVGVDVPGGWREEDLE